MKKKPVWLVMLAVLFISFVLRPPVAQIGPILANIQTGLNVDSTQLAVLTAVPVLCFGFGAFASPALVRRFGINHTMVYLLGILFLSVLVRPYVGYFGLLMGTTVAGLAIAVANVLLPAIVRQRFEKNVVLVTSAYTTILAASASFAAAFSFPSAQVGGWQFALAIWALPVLVAAIFSLTLLDRRESLILSDSSDHRTDWSKVLKSSTTWWVMGIFGLQSAGFYALLAWLPTVAIDGGMTPAAAGGLLSFMTIIGVPVRFVIASSLGKWLNLSYEGVIISLVTATGIFLLNLHLWVPAVILIGIGQASSFPLSLSLISTRAKTMELTTILSSVAQGVGYLLAAVGTFLFGILGKTTGSWQVSIYFLLAVTLIQLVSAWMAGRNRQIG